MIARASGSWLFFCNSDLRTSRQRKVWVWIRRLYWCWLLKSDSSLDPDNPLSRCFGHYSTLVQWDCNRCTVTKILRRNRTYSGGQREVRGWIEICFNSTTKLCFDCDLLLPSRHGSWVRLPWLAHDEAPGPYITIPQYRFNKTKHTHTHTRLSSWSRVYKRREATGLTGDRAESKRASSGRLDLLVSVSPAACGARPSVLILMAFVTGNSSLEPLLEGLLAQIQIDLSWRVFGRNRTRDLQITQIC